jgi:hypothetical protein
MNSLILTLNHWAGPVVGFAWPMLWQSSLLIGSLLTLDFVFRRKLREGRQGFVVTPLVEESEAAEAASLAEAYETLANGEL